MVLKVRENIVHKTRNERNGLILLITAVDHIQKRSQDLFRDETCHKQKILRLSDCNIFKNLPQPEVSEPVRCKLTVLKRKPSCWPEQSALIKKKDKFKSKAV